MQTYIVSKEKGHWTVDKKLRQMQLIHCLSNC